MGFLCYYLKAVFRRITEMIIFKIRFPLSLKTWWTVFTEYKNYNEKEMQKNEWTQLSLPGPESFSASDRSTLRPRGCMCWMSKISWYTLAHVQLVSSYICDCLYPLNWFRSENGCPRESLLQSDLYTWCWQRPGGH